MQVSFTASHRPCQRQFALRKADEALPATTQTPPLRFAVKMREMPPMISTNSIRSQLSAAAANRFLGGINASLWTAAIVRRVPDARRQSRDKPASVSSPGRTAGQNRDEIEVSVRYPDEI